MIVINTIKSLKTKTLIALYNKLTGKQTKKFASREKGEAQVIGAAKVAGQEVVTKYLKEIGVQVKENPYTPTKSGDLPQPSPVSAGRDKQVAEVDKVVSPKPKSGQRRTRKSRGTNLAPPAGAPVACREGTKQAALLDELARPEGTTMERLRVALSGGRQTWQDQTIRAGFGWDMKMKGYGVRSSFDEDGTERFFIVIPEGHSIPAHRPLKTK